MQNKVVVMRVLRVPPMGKLVVEINNQEYAALADVPDSGVQRLLKAAIGELVSFAGGYDILEEAGFAPPLVAPTARDEVPLEQQQAEFLASLEAERDALLNRSKPQTSALNDLGARPAPPLPPPPTPTVVEQIDAILQRYVSADPELSPRSIHLEQNTAGGLRIEVDGQYFAKPAEIKEPKIQVYIRQALKAWESR